MNITEELRSCISSWERDEDFDIDVLGAFCDDLRVCADRIDKEHGAISNRLEDYRKAINAMFREFVKLPTDADGVPIVEGEHLLTDDGRSGEAVGVGFGKRRDYIWILEENKGVAIAIRANRLRHAPDTWERIICDAFTAAQERFGSINAVNELVERCRRLANGS